MWCRPRRRASGWRPARRAAGPRHRAPPWRRASRRSRPPWRATRAGTGRCPAAPRHRGAGRCRPGRRPAPRRGGPWCPPARRTSAGRGCLRQQAGALAQRILVGRDVAGMLGMQRRHQPVEEAPALARPVEEQAVELRRQPDRRDMQAERGLALRPAGRRSARRGAAGCPRSRPAPGRCRWRAGPPACRAWRRPPRRRRPARRRARGGRPRRGGRGAGRGRAPGRTAPPGGWSCPRRWRRPARRARAAVEAELAIVAEIGEPKLAHGQDGRRCAGCGVGSYRQERCSAAPSYPHRHEHVERALVGAVAHQGGRAGVGHQEARLAPAICSVMSSR